MDTFQLVKALIYPTTHIDVVPGKQLKLLQKIFINCEISFLSLSHLWFSVFVLPVRLFGEFRCTYFLYNRNVVYHVVYATASHTGLCVLCVLLCILFEPFHLPLSQS